MKPMVVRYVPRTRYNNRGEYGNYDQISCDYVDNDIIVLIFKMCKL